MRIGDVTVRSNGSRLYSSASNGFALIDDVNAALQLQTTVASALNQISGGFIVDGVGNGLTVGDLGGGFVSISSTPLPPPPAPVPEPASLGLLSLGLLILAKRRI